MCPTPPGSHQVLDDSSQNATTVFLNLEPGNHMGHVRELPGQ